MKIAIAAVFAAGLFVSVDAANAQPKKDAPKTTAGGTVTMNGKTHRLVNALAYSLTDNEQKQTVVILCDKPLNAAQLKASLKKNGNAVDFDISGQRLEFVFDDKGAFRKISIYTQDGGIRNLDATEIKDHKATVAITDTAAKGRVNTTKANRNELTRNTYEFDVSFDLQLTKP
jgi:hypothetical protein